MSIQFLLSADQLARFDQAEALLAISRLPSFAEVRALFQQAQYDVQPALDRLAAAAAAGRPTHDQRESMQARFEGESGEVAEAVEAAARWIQRLHGRVRLATQMKTPGASKIARLLRVGDARPESYRDGVAMMGEILESADSVVLDPAFVAEGHQALATLRGERTDAIESEFMRKCLTISLHDCLDELGEVFEELARAVELVELETGRTVPGFDLALLRGAVARSPAKTVAPASPLPPMGLIPPLAAPVTNGVNG